MLTQWSGGDGLGLWRAVPIVQSTAVSVALNTALATVTLQMITAVPLYYTMASLVAILSADDLPWAGCDRGEWRSEGRVSNERDINQASIDRAHVLASR